MLTIQENNTLADLMYYRSSMRDKYPSWSGIKQSIIPHIRFLSEVLPDVDVYLLRHHFNPCTGEYIPDMASLFWGGSKEFGEDAWAKADKELVMWLADGILSDYERKHDEPMPRDLHFKLRVGTISLGEEMDEDRNLGYTPAEYRQVVLTNPYSFPFPDKWEIFLSILNEIYPDLSKT